MIKMLFLDDDSRRIKQFKRAAKKNLNTKDIHVAKSASEAILLMEKHRDFSWIFLDHDLGLPDNGRKTESKFYDELNCGLNVVDWLIATDYPKKTVMIIIHSWNIERGEIMENKLKESGYIAKYIPGAFYLLG